MSPSPSPSRLASPRVGLALLLLSALAFSTAGLFTRLSPVDLPALIVWRNLFGGAVLLPFALRGEGWRGGARLGVFGWATVAASALGTLCFLAALRLTSVADVSIIYAGAPLLTALLARACLGERPLRATLLATALAVAGVAVAVAGGGGGRTLRGDALALLMTLSLAGMTVLARRAGRRPVLLVACLSALLAAGAALPLALVAGARLAVSPGEAAVLAVFGVTTMGVALPAYLAGAARLPPARAMLLSALEMPLAPLWVWLAFGTVPSAAALGGGAIVALAILCDLATPTCRQGE